MHLRTLFIFIFVILLGDIFSQTNCYDNNSIEGTPQSHVVPSPWNTCWGSPDTQPNQWGITQPASNGSTYVSFLAMDNYSYLEGMTQPLTTCMVAGQTYTFSVDLCHTNTYNTAEPGNCYSSFAVWGGNSACDRSELLYCSGEIWNTNWQTYSITFTPTQNWCYIGFSPCYLTSCSGYINLMMDNISCITPASSLVETTNVTCNGLCDGTATVNATGGTPPFTFLWSNGATTQTITNLCPDDFSVIVTDAASQQAFDTVTITEPAPLTVSLAVDNNPCVGTSTGAATATPTGDMPPFTYLWQPSGQTTATASGLIAGTYNVTVTDSTGCTVTDNIVIDALPLPPADAGPDQGICISGQVTITASGGTSYLWDTGDNTATINVTPAVTTTYTVTVTDDNSCSESDNIVVNVNNLPTANAGSDVNACLGSNIPLNASGGTTYVWSPTTALSNPNVANPLANPTTAVTYTVTVTDAYGCSGTDDVIVGIYPSPNVAFTANPLNGCQPLTVQFNDISTPSIQIWAWDFGDNNTSSGQNPSHTYQNQGSFNVTLTVTTTDGCIGTSTVPNMVEVYPNPDAEFLMSASIASVENPVVDFQDASAFATIWTWNFGDPNSSENTSSEPNPTHTYSLQGTYTVFLMVQTAHGCTDTTSKELTIKPDFTLYIPNVFTPDYDGLNDFFQAHGTNITEYEMRIFNRWGELLFKTDDINCPWDGISPDSNEAYMQDVYVYRIFARDMNGKRHYYYGHVTLLD